MREGVKKDTSLSVLSDLFAYLVYWKDYIYVSLRNIPEPMFPGKAKYEGMNRIFNQMLYLHHVTATAFCPDFLP